MLVCLEKWQVAVLCLNQQIRYIIYLYQYNIFAFILIQFLCLKSRSGKRIIVFTAIVVTYYH
jgi:hypothetical protein